MYMCVRTFMYINTSHNTHAADISVVDSVECSYICRLKYMYVYVYVCIYIYIFIYICI